MSVKENKSIEYKKGFEDGWHCALKEINIPMKMVVKSYNPSVCPRCISDFRDYEECYDGYYKRAYNLKRCPYCGQKIKWN